MPARCLPCGRGGRTGPFRDEQQQGQVDGKARVRQGQAQGQAQVQAAAQAGQDQGKKPKPKPKPAKVKEKERGGRREGGGGQEKEKAKAAPRPPADPRLKFIKKFHGKFLPRGPLRDRLKALMARWDSGEDHGGVTVEELKSLYEDWKADRAKQRRPAATSGLRVQRSGRGPSRRRFSTDSPRLAANRSTARGDHRGGLAGTIVGRRRDGLPAPARRRPSHRRHPARGPRGLARLEEAGLRVQCAPIGAPGGFEVLFGQIGRADPGRRDRRVGRLAHPLLPEGPRLRRLAEMQPEGGHPVQHLPDDRSGGLAFSRMSAALARTARGQQARSPRDRARPCSARSVDGRRRPARADDTRRFGSICSLQHTRSRPDGAPRSAASRSSTRQGRLVHAPPGVGLVEPR